MWRLQGLSFVNHSFFMTNVKDKVFLKASVSEPLFFCVFVFFLVCVCVFACLSCVSCHELGKIGHQPISLVMRSAAAPLTPGQSG